MSSQAGIISQLEDTADQVLRKSKHVLPHVARFFLVSTFIEDGIRMFHQWGEQRDYIDSSWNCGWLLATTFVVLNLFVQLGAAFMILTRKNVKEACAALYFIIFLQTIAYQIMFDMKFLARNLALIGAVCLLLAEVMGETRTIFAGVPTLDDNQSKNYLQLSGRILLILMFMTLLHFTMSLKDLVVNLVGLSMMVLVAVGYKTKLVSLIMVCWLLLLNFVMNDFWRHRSTSIMWDFKKYDFFQALTVCGGLLLLTAFGPGGVSIDERKKMF